MDTGNKLGLVAVYAVNREGDDQNRGRCRACS